MLTAFKFIKRIGKFHEVTSGSSLALARLSLVYAENARGKTTLSAILRSLSTGQPGHILERWRLGESDQPLAVLESSTGTTTFQNGSWSTTHPEIAIFDDVFVAENVHAGMQVDGEHRHNLHELIIGARGVRLNEELQAEIAKNEAHNKALARKSELIPTRLRGSLSPDAFSDLVEIPDLPGRIQEAERALSAARENYSISRREPLPALGLPRFNVTQLREVLSATLVTLEREAMAQVQSHIRAIGSGGEAWIADGSSRANNLAEKGSNECPYCGQLLKGSHLVQHYQAYFSDAYRGLKGEVESVGKTLSAQHSDSAVAAFERNVRIAQEARTYWSRFAEIPPLGIDIQAIIDDWRAASVPLLEALRRKYVAPLEEQILDPSVAAAIDRFHTHVEQIDDVDAETRRLNGLIALVKERASSANVAVLEQDLKKLQLNAARYSDEGREVAARYIAERTAKAETKQRMDLARAALEAYRTTVFPAYQERINHYLGRLNASFRLERVLPVNHRAGSSAGYYVLIDAIGVPVPLVPEKPNGPSVKSTLSAGDRNTLALAFFLSSIDLDPDPKKRIVLFDDPMTSLDAHRTSATCDEILALSGRVEQVLVLSHSMPFLCDLWERAKTNNPKASLQIMRDKQNTSTFAAWDVSRDMITEHDKRAELVLKYLDNPAGIESRRVAEALRPILEASLRVSFPDWFPPHTNLGDFRSRCLNVVGKAEEKLSGDELDELGKLTNYGNRFHHDSNPSGYATAAVNDSELSNFASRTIKFMRRRA